MCFHVVVVTRNHLFDENVIEHCNYSSTSPAWALSSVWIFHPHSHSGAERSYFRERGGRLFPSGVHSPSFLWRRKYLSLLSSSLTSLLLPLSKPLGPWFENCKPALRAEAALSAVCVCVSAIIRMCAVCRSCVEFLFPARRRKWPT